MDGRSEESDVFDDGGPAVVTADPGPAPHGRTDLHDRAQCQEIERALVAVPGVLGARLVPGFDREVDELHVVSSLERAPKQIVRDVQTLLMARFGVTTDHRVISVVQLDAASDSPGSLAGATTTDPDPSVGRVSIDRVTVSHAGPKVGVEVALRRADATFLGRGTGTSSPQGRRSAIGRAVLDALCPLFGDEVAAELRGCELIELLDHQIVLTVVQLQTPSGERSVTGSAVVRDTSSVAVVRSVLDALNRTADLGAQ